MSSNWSTSYDAGAPDVTEAPRQFEIRPMSDRKMLTELLTMRWVEGSIHVRGTLWKPTDVEALGAYRDNRLAGVITYRIEGDVLRLMTLNNVTDQRGVGAALLDALIAFGREKGLRLLQAVFTNDNVAAFRFYQKRGLRLNAVYPGAVDKAREMKPAIALYGPSGIRTRDEIEMVLEL